MDIKEAIKERHSVRQYTEASIEGEIKNALDMLISRCNEESGLNIQIICNDPECFNILLNRFGTPYGRFRNVINYIALVGKSSMENLEETCGYYGQKIVLTAQTMGLNTCWVAGTFGKGKCKAVVAPDEKLVCVISIGFGINNGSSRKTKPMEKLSPVSIKDMPEWFREGMKAAMLAPTAINQQKFSIDLVDGEAVATAKKGPYSDIDLGIVKYNFEAASGHKCK